MLPNQIKEILCNRRAHEVELPSFTILCSDTNTVEDECDIEQLGLM